MFGTLVTKRQHVEIGEQALAGAEQDGGDCNVHFVNQAGTQVLLNRRHAPAKPNIEPIGRFVWHAPMR